MLLWSLIFLVTAGQFIACTPAPTNTATTSTAPTLSTKSIVAPLYRSNDYGRT
ncbi:MAG: hypothetical protein ACRBFS_03380 [Aureispira sp.]